MLSRAERLTTWWDEACRCMRPEDLEAFGKLICDLHAMKVAGQEAESVFQSGLLENILVRLWHGKYVDANARWDFLLRFEDALPKSMRPMWHDVVNSTEESVAEAVPCPSCASTTSGEAQGIRTCKVDVAEVVAAMGPQWQSVQGLLGGIATPDADRRIEVEESDLPRPWVDLRAPTFPAQKAVRRPASDRRAKRRLLILEIQKRVADMERRRDEAAKRACAPWLTCDWDAAVGTDDEEQQQDAVDGDEPSLRVQPPRDSRVALAMLRKELAAPPGGRSRLSLLRRRRCSSKSGASRTSPSSRTKRRVTRTATSDACEPTLA